MASEKSIVISFGRFNPPTTGHEKLIDFIRQTARKLNADAMVFPSQSQDPKKNPLPFKEKVNFLRKFFPNGTMNFSDVESIKTPFHALEACSRLGYDNVFVVVGSDRVVEFQKFGNYIVPRRRKSTDLVLKNYTVVPVPGERDFDEVGVQGMSASKLRLYAVSGDYRSFRSGVPTRIDALAKQLYQSVRSHMGVKTVKENRTIKENVKLKHAFMLYADRALVEAFSKTVSARILDVSGQPYQNVVAAHQMLKNAGYETHIYVKESALPRKLNENWIRQQMTYGMLRRYFASALVLVNESTEALKHATSVMEAETSSKQPSEVDRMKTQQQQEILATKTRQNNELLQAKQRELQKKSREDQEKIANGDKARSITK